jgi:hypothetical protein
MLFEDMTRNKGSFQGRIYRMFHVLYPFVAYLLTLPRSLHGDWSNMIGLTRRITDKKRNMDGSITTLIVFNRLVASTFISHIVTGPFDWIINFTKLVLTQSGEKFTLQEVIIPR